MKTSTVSKQQQSFLVLLLLQIIIMMMTALQHGVKAYVLRPTTSLLFRRTHKPASLVQIRQWSDDWTDSAPPPPRRKQRGDDYNPDGRRGGARQPRDNDNNFTGRGNNQFDNNNYNRNRGDFRRGGGGDNRRQRWSNERGPPNRNRNNNLRGGRREDDTSTKIDMKGLEAEGFVHIYGLAPTLSALKANRRDFAPKEQATNDIISREDEFRFDDDNEDDDFAAFQNEEETKPEAQFTSWLFLQDRSGSAGSSRSGDKAAAANEVKRLAEERGIPIHYTDKGSLNALSGNRPHQGFVLRCGALEFEHLARIPYPSDDDDNSVPRFWLVLDEVVDPQNLGALLRSSYFLCGSGNNRMGILVCSKNSAPPSPVVSAASAGALELLDVYSTSSLPKTLSTAREDGFRIIGAASSRPKRVDDESAALYDLQNLPPSDNNQPTLLVLGSEGHGLRTLVARLCTEFVRIPRGDVMFGNDDENEDGTNSSGIVDSLNVSVTGGILLWHLLYGNK